jgi:hypothetical protein
MTLYHHQEMAKSNGVDPEGESLRMMEEDGNEIEIFD